MDWSKFFSMGGYGFYVWGSYVVSLLAIGAEVFSLIRRKKNLVKKTSQVQSSGSTFK
jgi:heme exporter protein D